MSENVTIKIGQEFPLTIKRLGINGEGVGFFKKHVVFVPGALPGEVITAHVTEVQRRFATAKIKQIREKSEDRVTPPCPVYDACGGCQLQHMTYTRQLVEKRDIQSHITLTHRAKVPANGICGIVGIPMTVPVALSTHPWYASSQSLYDRRR